MTSNLFDVNWSKNFLTNLAVTEYGNYKTNGNEMNLASPQLFTPKCQGDRPCCVSQGGELPFNKIEQKNINSSSKKLLSAGFEPTTLSVLTICDSHYTTKAWLARSWFKACWFWGVKTLSIINYYIVCECVFVCVSECLCVLCVSVIGSSPAMHDAKP